MRTVALIVAAGRGERFGGALPKQYACLGGIAGAAAFNPGVCRPSRRSTRSRVVIGPDDARRSTARRQLGSTCCRRSIGGDDAAGHGAARPGEPGRAGAGAGPHPRRRPAAGLGGGDRPGARRAGPASPRCCRCCRWSTRSSGWTAAACIGEADRERSRPGADAAGLPLRRDPGGAPCGRAASYTDDAAVAAAAGLRVAWVAGEERNLKLTRPEDLSLAERLLGDATRWRTGLGFRRACLRAGPTARAVRGHGAARAGAGRPFRRRRRLPRDHRRDPGHDRRRRHRQPLPAQRPAMARRGFRAASCATLPAAGRARAGGSRTSTW